MGNVWKMSTGRELSGWELWEKEMSTSPCGITSLDVASMICGSLLNTQTHKQMREVLTGDNISSDRSAR